MKLSDMVGAAGHEGFALVGLAIAIVAFAIVLVVTLRRRHDATFDRARHLPLDDGDIHR